MTPPTIVITIALEACPRLEVYAANTDEIIRLADWIDACDFPDLVDHSVRKLREAA